jgi:catechol 2,3-dioxygenase-like lactoylglutathione lyase family enzyme
MAQLNHTIVWSRDRHRAAAFLAEILGLPAPRQFYHFQVVELGNGVSLDFMDHPEPIDVQHYAFLVSDDEFDAGMGRIRDKGLTFWADPARAQAGEINHHFGGRGVYFPNPDGHLLELITKPYGSEADQ